jgi:outer membrane protein TolC
VIVVADTSKLDRASLSMIVPLSRVDRAETARGKLTVLQATVTQDRQALAVLIGTAVPDELALAAPIGPIWTR